VSARVLPFHGGRGMERGSGDAASARNRAIVRELQRSVRLRLFLRKAKRVIKRGPWAWSR
jgi:hypothetical protein